MTIGFFFYLVHVSSECYLQSKLYPQWMSAYHFKYNKSLYQCFCFILIKLHYILISENNPMVFVMNLE